MRAALGVIAMTFVFSSGCAQQDWIDRTLVTVDVTGVWEGRQDFGTSGSRDIVLVLQQQGPKVTGEIRGFSSAGVGSAGSTPLQGTMNGDTLSLRSRWMSVVLQVNGDEMTGSGDAANRSFQVSLHRQPTASSPR